MKGTRSLWWRVPTVLLSAYLMGFLGAMVGGRVGFALAPATNDFTGLAWVVIGVTIGVGVSALPTAFIAAGLGFRWLFAPVMLAVAGAGLLSSPHYRDALIPCLAVAPVIGLAAGLPVRWWIRVLATLVLTGSVATYVVQVEQATQRAHTTTRADAFAEAGVGLYAPADPDARLKWAATDRDHRTVSDNAEIGDREFEIRLQSLASPQGVTSCTVWGRPGQLHDVWVSTETDNVVCREVDGVQILVSGVPAAPVAELEQVAAGMQRSTPDRFAASSGANEQPR